MQFLKVSVKSRKPPVFINRVSLRAEFSFVGVGFSSEGMLNVSLGSASSQVTAVKQSDLEGNICLL